MTSADFSVLSLNDHKLPTPPQAGSFPSMPHMGIDPPLAESVSHLGKTIIFQSIAAGSTYQVSK
jgi:hypothetical protein